MQTNHNMTVKEGLHQRVEMLARQKGEFEQQIQDYKDDCER